MSRLRVGLALLVLLPLLLWGSFRIWLHRQPPELRAAIEQFSPVEFLFVLRDAALAPAHEDRAGYGRRIHEGRGHAPWVLRTSLDGRPRMLSLALAPELWLSYSTETASIHRLWQGEIDFSGAVFDGRHGREPVSRGLAFLDAPTSTAWRVYEEGDWRPAKVQWMGHGFDPTSGALWLRFAVRGSDARERIVTEWPELLNDAGRIGLERRFEVEGQTGSEIALRITPGVAALEADRESIENGNETLLPLAGEGTRLVQWHGEATIPIGAPPAAPIEQDPFAAHDCHTCHSERERVVGPAWSEIALRYEGTNRNTTLQQLASRIVEGSVDSWGSTPMPPHPDLPEEEAMALALRVLEMEPAEAPGVAVGDASATPTWTYGFQTEPRPATLHPSLSATRIHDEVFTPQVGGLAWLPDGRLAVATWDRDGSVYAIEGWDGPAGSMQIERIAEGLHEPLGLAVVGDDLYVMQKQEITQLVDVDGDDWVDEYRTISNAWSATSNFHEFGFGLVPLDDHLYGSLSACVLVGGKSCRHQTPDRGKVFRVSLETGAFETVASGFRTPNGLGATADGDLLVTDNQGDWLPSSKLILLEPGAFYGWRAPGDERDHGPARAPELWLPQNEVGNSPTQPLVLSSGPYAGHVVFGDVFNGGLKRAWLEEVNGRVQGAAFHFSGGLEGPVNRVLAAPDGSLVVGEIGSGGNWSEFGKNWYGLELLRFSDEPAFEPMRVSATPDGFDVHFSRPIDPDLEIQTGHFRLSQWFYIPTERYGGPKYDVSDLQVLSAESSAERQKVSLRVDGLKAGHIVYLWIDRAIRSERGEDLWINEAWYTLNERPEPDDRDAPSPTNGLGEPNTLTEAERIEGWELLFDGESFDGWKIYGAEDDTIEAWVIEDGALKFTRDVSVAGLIWNHLNPFTPGAIDLMTRRQFESFELSIDWKISPGGNSGIFYLVPDEEAPLSWTYALEMQVLDDDEHSDGRLDKRRAGDLYDLAAGARRVTRPVGEWNRARIRVQGDEIEHWLNGEHLLSITRGSPAWERAMQESKFADVEGHGSARRGHITLQDHGDVVWYRNIKIRELDPSDPVAD